MLVMESGRCPSRRTPWPTFSTAWRFHAAIWLGSSCLVSATVSGPWSPQRNLGFELSRKSSPRLMVIRPLYPYGISQEAWPPFSPVFAKKFVHAGPSLPFFVCVATDSIELEHVPPELTR